MKTFVLCSLLAILGANAQDTSDITTRVSERRNTDGSLRWRNETTFRDGTKILFVHHSTKGGVTNTSRSYLVGGEVAMMEVDEDGNGSFETFIVYRPEKKDIEVFTRMQDGSVQPASSKTLATLKQQHAAFDEFFMEAFDKSMDANKFVDKIRRTREKVRAAEEEKRDAK
ncbi:MAG TPA: hypothetical protein VN673_12040 [Clostridia bacterium]|nr:hypothetical protein [Clostridia bacterium]